MKRTVGPDEDDKTFVLVPTKMKKQQRSKGPFTRCDFFSVRLHCFASHGMDCMDVNDTVHTVRLRFD